MRFSRTLLAVAAVTCAGTAHAQSISFFDGLTQVAELTWSDGTNFALEFMTAPDPDAFVFDITFQGVAGTFTDTDLVSDSTGSFSSGTWTVKFETANNPGRLTIGETATWSITPTFAADFGDPSKIHINAYINDQSIKLDGCVSNCPVPGPIPEPETYALMLAGLGVVGYMARRRRSK